MPPLFLELDYRLTDFGTLILRWRCEWRLAALSHEIKLGGDFGVTSTVTTSELALVGRRLEALA